MHARRRPSNSDVASQLEEAAAVLRSDGVDKFRVRAYLEGARTLRTLREPVSTLLEREGRAGLLALPAIGPALAQRIEEMLHARDPVSEQLSIFGGDADDNAADDDDDEAAATTSSVGRVVRDLFDDAPSERLAKPSVAQLLSLDRGFRERAAPAAATGARSGGEWLPTWQLEERGRRFSVAFSKSGTAHRMGRTHDWVVIGYEQDGAPEQATIVTEYRGPLAGRRVVRGRERECLRFWASQTEDELAQKRWHRAG